MRKDWTRIGKYCVQHKDKVHRVSCTRHGDELKYTLWRKKEIYTQEGIRLRTWVFDRAIYRNAADAMEAASKQE